MKVLVTHSPEETIELASSLSGHLSGGDVVALVGELGSGKTMFVKGLAKGLGVKEYEYVNSPSFVIIKEYPGKKIDLYHFDVYRLESSEFCDTLDWEKYFYGSGITVIEWADKVLDLLPEEYIKVKIDHLGENERKLEIKPVGKRSKETVKSLK